MLRTELTSTTSWLVHLGIGALRPVPLVDPARFVWTFAATGRRPAWQHRN
jgi:hypothetical protein